MNSMVSPVESNGSIQVHPVARDPNVSLVHPPGSIRMSSLQSQSWIQNRRIPLYPAPDGNVIDRQTALRHHLLQVAVAKRVPQIPSHAQYNDLVLEVSPTEQLWSLSTHRITVPNAFRRDCNRSD